MADSYVKNAADEGQVKEADRKVKYVRNDELNDVRTVLSTRAGRRFLWRTLSFCKVYGSVWEPSARIHYNAGLQDVGHHLLAEIMEANPDAYLEMQKENRKETQND